MSKFHNPIYEKDRWAANRSKAFLIAVLSVNSVITVIAIVVFMNMVSYMKTSSENDYAALLQLYLTLAMAECLMIRFYRPGTCRNWHQSGARKWKSGAVFIDGCFAMAGNFRKACFLHEYDVCAYCDITSSFFTCICVRWCSDARSYCNDQRASCCCT